MAKIFTKKFVARVQFTVLRGSQEGLLWTLQQTFLRAGKALLSLMVLSISSVAHVVGFRRVPVLAKRVSHLAAEADCYLKLYALRKSQRHQRRLFIPADEMSEDNLHRRMNRLRKHKPVLIDGYAESFNFLAHYLKQHGLSGVRPKGIMLSAQILPEQSRQIIAEEFGCGVFDKYGSREFSGIAYESDAHDGHLVVDENVIVEILKDRGRAEPGEMGEVVITDSNKFCMPFIRYRVGDLAVAMDNSKPSPCGRGLSRIGNIEGRVQAITVGTNGNYVPRTFFAHLFKDYDHVIAQYQVMQEKLGAITLKIVKAQRFNREGFQEILDQLHHFLGNDMDITVEYVDLIPLGRTGKRQGAISKLGIDWQNSAKNRMGPKVRSFPTERDIKTTSTPSIRS